MDLALATAQTFASQTRLVNAVLGLRRLSGRAPALPAPRRRPGELLVDDLFAYLSTGMSARELAALELGVADTSYLVWAVRSPTDETFLGEALAWGAHGALALHWFDLGTALERERRHRSRGGLVARARDFVFTTARKVRDLTSRGAIAAARHFLARTRAHLEGLMREGIGKVYRSFEEFERDELRRLDRMNFSVDDMLDEMFAEELDFDGESVRRSRVRDEDDQVEE